MFLSTLKKISGPITSGLDGRTTLLGGIPREEREEDQINIEVTCCIYLCHVPCDLLNYTNEHKVQIKLKEQ